MKKIIFYCTLLFSSIIALAILLHGYMLSDRIFDELSIDSLMTLFVIFVFLLLILSIIVSLIGLCKKVKNKDKDKEKN